MEYSDSKGTIDTAKKILKVDHAGEFGAVNIYKSQIFISKLFGREYVPMLEKFLEDEKRHLNLFWNEITRRKGIKCKSYWLCGAGGYFMGFLSAILGKKRNYGLYMGSRVNSDRSFGKAINLFKKYWRQRSI